MLAWRHGGGGPKMNTRPRWASRGYRTGIVLSLPVLVAIALFALFPDLRFGYSLVLLPLLSVGPGAAHGLRLPGAFLGIVLAGLTSAALAAGGLVVGSRFLGTPD